jgi:hypothetical protein
MQHVYVMYNLETGRVKIGITGDIKNRLYSIITASGCIVVVLYVSKSIKNAEYIEGQIHNELKDYRLIGEWFNADIKTAINTTSRMCGDTYNVEDNTVMAQIVPLDKFINMGGNAYRNVNGDVNHITFTNGKWLIK